jgi:hypothetical protein
LEQRDHWLELASERTVTLLTRSPPRDVEPEHVRSLQTRPGKVPRRSVQHLLTFPRAGIGGCGNEKEGHGGTLIAGADRLAPSDGYSLWTPRSKSRAMSHATATS